MLGDVIGMPSYPTPTGPLQVLDGVARVTPVYGSETLSQLAGLIDPPPASDLVTEALAQTAFTERISRLTRRNEAAPVFLTEDAADVALREGFLAAPPIVEIFEGAAGA